MMFAVQLRKMLSSAAARGFIAFSVLAPAILAVLIHTGAGGVMDVSSDGPMPGIGYMGSMPELALTLLVPYMFLAAMAASSVAGDVECGIEAMYIVRAKRRTSVVLSKLAAMALLALLATTAYYLSAFACWHLILRGANDFSSSAFWSDAASRNACAVFTLALIPAALIATVPAFCALAVALRSQIQSFMACMVLVIAERLLSGLEAVQNVLPDYIATGTGLYAASEASIGRTFLFGLTACLLIAAVGTLACVTLYRRVAL